MRLMESGGLVIDWTQMPTYNTIMAIAAGAGLVFVVLLGRSLLRGKEQFVPEGWALAAGVLGFLLTATGLHMTLTWPFAKYFPFDDIIFGETSLGFGVLLLAASFLLWRRAGTLVESDDPGTYLARIARPLGVFVFGLGLALIAIAAAGMAFRLFAAPAEEPISGAFADYPWIEATFMSGLFALVGVGAILFPFALKGFSSGAKPTKVQWATGGVWMVAGVVFVLFGAMNFFTHIGLIVNTMG